eukprot:4088520-Alexandrium_andersonii.AAC.1
MHVRVCLCVCVLVCARAPACASLVRAELHCTLHRLRRAPMRMRCSSGAALRRDYYNPSVFELLPLPAALAGRLSRCR